MRNKKTINSLLTFFVEVEKLKTIIRHSYTSNPDRMESTAEHSWMLCLIAISVFPYVTTPMDTLKALKMLILHDLAEVTTGDIPAFDLKGREGKYEREKAAMELLVQNLPQDLQEEFLELWQEYEDKKTNEAKFAQAIDKFEAPLQHNISDISTWDQNDYDVHGKYKQGYLDFDPFLKELREELEHMSRKKITKADQLHRLKPEIQEFYKNLNDIDSETSSE